MQDVVTVILGGGRGTRLFPLTRTRSEPAVPIAGKYRLIDIPVSNCINSGLHKIYIVTQYLSVSLHRHVANTFDFDQFTQGFVEILPAQQTNEASRWYSGTADAIRQNLLYLDREDPRDVLILSADQLYRMDFRELLRTHRESGAEVTLGLVPVTREQAGRFGVARVADDLHVVELIEKPSPRRMDDLRTSTDWLRTKGVEAPGREFLANMGIYLFRWQALNSLLASLPQASDLVTELFGGPVIPSGRVRAALFGGYWTDVGTVKAYQEASLALASDDPPFDFHAPEGVIYTRARNLPASRIAAAQARQCLISDGCTIQEGARLERCVVGVRSQIGRNAILRDTVMLGADSYESPAEREASLARGIPPLGVGENTIIEGAILDKDCRIGRQVRIVNQHNLQEHDGNGYYVREGIVVVPNGGIIPDGTVI